MSIEKLAKALNIDFNGTFSDQAKHIQTIEWLLDPVGSEDFKDKGRTNLLALGFINAAMENPGFPIPIFDHYNCVLGQLNIEDRIEKFIESMPEDIRICFSCVPYTITFSPKSK